MKTELELRSQSPIENVDEVKLCNRCGCTLPMFTCKMKNEKKEIVAVVCLDCDEKMGGPK